MSRGAELNNRDTASAAESRPGTGGRKMHVPTCVPRRREYAPGPSRVPIVRISARRSLPENRLGSEPSARWLPGPDHRFRNLRSVALTVARQGEAWLTLTGC